MISREKVMQAVKEFAPLGGILVVAAVLRCHLISLPGPYYDELYFSNVARRMLLNESGPIYLYSLTIKHHWVPLCYDPNASMFPTYLEAVFQFVFPSVDYLYRYINIGYALFSMVVAYFLGKMLWGRGYGLLFAAILAILPLSVIESRVGNSNNFSRILVSAPMFYFIFSWLKHKRPIDFYALAFFTGLGFSGRAEVPLWIGLGLFFIVIFDAEARRQFLKVILSPKALPISIILFVIGAGVFIVTNYYYNGIFFKFVGSNLSSTHYGHSNSAFFANFQTRMKHLGLLTTGALGQGYCQTTTNYFWYALLIGSAAYTVIFSLRWRLANADRVVARRTFLLLAFAMIGSTLTVTIMNASHLNFLMFLPIMLVLAVMHETSRYRVAKYMFIVALVGAVSIDGLNIYKFYDGLGRHIDRGYYSEGMYNLVDYADKNLGDHKIFLGNWGLLQPLDFLSKRGLELHEQFGGSLSEVTPKYYDSVNESLRKYNKCAFIFYAKSYDKYVGLARRQYFEDYLKKMQVPFDKVTINDLQGLECYEVFIPHPTRAPATAAAK